MAAAVRLARVATGQGPDSRFGYHGWLDWCEPKESSGVPAATRAHVRPDSVRTIQRVRGSSSVTPRRLASVVFEPIILREPGRNGSRVREETPSGSGALLVVDEIKTVLRIAVGGATERYGLEPDLIVMAQGDGEWISARRGGRKRGGHGGQSAAPGSPLPWPRSGWRSRRRLPRARGGRPGVSGAPGREWAAGCCPVSPPRGDLPGTFVAGAGGCRDVLSRASRRALSGDLRGPRPGAASSSNDPLITSSHWRTTRH